MKQINKSICAVFLLSILTMLGGISIAQASITTAQDKTLAFIENVLPFDSTQYNITLRNYGVPKLPELGSTQPINGEQEVLTYSLESKDSALDVICTVQNNAVTMVNAYVVKGTAISDKSYSNVGDAAKDFLQKYESHVSLDSSKMIDMISKVDSVKNSTTTADNLKLTVTHIDATGTFFGDSIDFRWVQTFNGCDYLLLDVSFRDGVFSGLIDRRPVYTIGDTSVNISKEEAIKIAMDAIKDYSYRMSDDWIVTGFNVTEDKAVAGLQPQTKESNVLYPIWSVILPLDGTWPGSVTDLLVEVWAGTGEVHLVHHLAYGSSDITSDTDIISDTSSTSESTTTTTPSPQSYDTNETPVNFGMIALIVFAIVAIATVTTLAVKKRHK
ncbi:MAG: hypothetical protein ACQCN3_09190 [Candidatus Bathyarchaeia archaeon]|jgi:hypothetical protein